MWLSSSTVTGRILLAGGSAPGKVWSRNSIFANNSGAKLHKRYDFLARSQPEQR